VPAKARPNTESPWAALPSPWRQRRLLEGQVGKGRGKERGRSRKENSHAHGGRRKGLAWRVGEEKERPRAARLQSALPGCAARTCIRVFSSARLLCARLPASSPRPPLLLCALPCCCQVLKARGDPDCSLPGIALCLCSTAYVECDFRQGLKVLNADC
jgi:hypothetical protein